MMSCKPCRVHTARTVMPRVSGTAGLFASFRRAGLRFRTIAEMMPLGWHDGKSTANAVGPNGPPGFKSPILRLLSSGCTRSPRRVSRCFVFPEASRIGYWLRPAPVTTRSQSG